MGSNEMKIETDGVEDWMSDLSPELEPGEMSAIDGMAMLMSQLVSSSSVGKYDNIGNIYDKNTIGVHIAAHQNLGRSVYMTVLHNSATMAKDDKGLATVKSFHSYHVNVRGWKAIGYHWIISKDGTIYAGRKMNLLGSHAGSKGNPGSIGVCMIGNFETTDVPPQAQTDAFAALHKALAQRFYGPSNGLINSVRFHNEFMNTACPGKITKAQIKTWFSAPTSTPKPQPPSALTVEVDGVVIGEGAIIENSAWLKCRDFEKAGYSVEFDEKLNRAIMKKK